MKLNRIYVDRHRLRSPTIFMNPKCCWSRTRTLPSMVPARPPVAVISHPSAMNIERTELREAPSARRVVMSERFSITIRLRVDTMLNEAMMRMNTSMRNVTHFSTAIMR